MTIKLYWCRGAGRSDRTKQNFGDYLSPLIVELLSGKKVEYASIKKADMMAIGSILPRLDKSKKFKVLTRKMHVWGAGTNTRNILIPGKHYYHAVRGKYSLSQINNSSAEVALGDPGLLAVLLSDKCKPANPKRLGVIPHFLDKNNSKILEILTSEPSSKIIDVYDKPEKVISEVRGCDFILSSSMHGLIMADAFEIPNVRAVFRPDDINSFKFEDYYSIYDDVEPSMIDFSSKESSSTLDYDVVKENYTRNNLLEIGKNLLASFPRL